MLHSDIIPEHSCDGELIPLEEVPTYLSFVRCSSCGTEFAFRARLRLGRLLCFQGCKTDRGVWGLATSPRPSTCPLMSASLAACPASPVRNARRTRSTVRRHSGVVAANTQRQTVAAIRSMTLVTVLRLIDSG